MSVVNLGEDACPHGFVYPVCKTCHPKETRTRSMVVLGHPGSFGICIDCARSEPLYPDGRCHECGVRHDNEEDEAVIELERERDVDGIIESYLGQKP